MSRIWPSGEIKLYNIPQSDILNGRALIFSSADEREQYFEAYRIATESPVTVVKKRKNPIRLGVDIATIKQATYMSFKNPDFDNKLYYAIIKDYDYLNNNVTEVSYAIDWWYTDMFNVVFERCHMAREGLSVKEKHYLDINPYDVNCCEKMRSQEQLTVTSDLELPHYDLGTIGNNYYEDHMTMPQFKRGDDGGDVFIEQACQNKYVGGEAPVYGYGTTNYPSAVKDRYKIYPFRYYGVNNVITEADSWSDTAPLVPCVMFSSIDFHYLDAEFAETRDNYSYSGMSANWLKDVDGYTDWATYSSGSTTTPSNRFKTLINYIRSNSNFYVMAFPREAVTHRVSGGTNYTLIYNCNWKTAYTGTVIADHKVNDWQLKNTTNLYPRPYYMIAAAPIYDGNHTPAYFNPVQEIIDLLTEWNMSSAILGCYMLPADLLRNTFAKDQDIGGKSKNNSIIFNSSYQRKLDGYNYGESPKLLQSPYSYLTIETSDGTSLCDYAYEDMSEDHTLGDSDYVVRRNGMQFGIMSEVNSGSIRMSVAPVNGKRVMKIATASSVYLGDSFIATDLQKMVTYDAFPQAPYTTDAYMAFLAGVNASLASQSSKNNLIDIQKGLIDVNANEEGARFLDSAKKVVKTVTHAGTTIAGIATGNAALVVKGGTGLMEDTADLLRGANKEDKFYLQRQQLENQQSMVDDVGKGALTNLKGSVIADMYAKSTSAFAMRNYVAGTNGGVSATNIYGTGQRILYIHHRLRPDILSVYDDYFRMYGYTTNKYKKPALAYYLSEGYADASEYTSWSVDYNNAAWDSASNLKAYGPQWETFDNENVFFTQCTKCYVTGVCQDSRDFIEALFEGGCRFVRPTPITPSNS